MSSPNNDEAQTIVGDVRDRRVELATGAVFHDARVSGCDLSGQRVPIFQAAATTFESCDFSRVRLDAATLGALPFATYRDCRFTDADLSRAIPGIARFERCQFENTRIDGWFGFQAEFVACTFSGPIRSVRFYGLVQPGELVPRLGRGVNEFHGNDFRRADLEDVEFVGGIDLDQQRWPASPGYRRIDRLPDRLQAARHVVERWPPSPDRDAALAELATLAEVYRGQASVIHRSGGRSGLFDRIWTIIQEVPPLA